MKKLVAIALILFFLTGITACQPNAAPPPAPSQTPAIAITAPAPSPTAIPSSTPIPALNSPNGPPLKMLRMFNARDGWGLIYNSLLTTHNGGLNWFSVPLPDAQVDDQTEVFFRDASNAYLVIPAPDGISGLLYQTSNGGGSWQITPVPFLRGKFAIIDRAIYFLETTSSGPNKMGVAVYLSVDNNEWSKMSPANNTEPGANIPEDGIKTGFAFIDIDQGWMGVAEQPQKIVVYHTKNAGANWNPIELPAPQNINSLITSSLPPIFFDGQAGILPVDFYATEGGEKNRVFYSSMDGGVTWLPGSAVVDGQAYTFLDPKTGWVWGKRGLYFTNDSGQTWQLMPLAFGRSEYATSLSFIDAKNGWMLTADAQNRVRIYNSLDGGNTWMAVNP